ncbi:hypothetical protein CERZMDRAFT_82684 [Cercospora zeae-maydis SCOH1-5]|uniref:Uncharacterized protein n=1 Tax=Cercospora zeae-maydis SCOH1-5 TaxID=717836 RepID=A0A6A6FMS8_9PEZI|nr:hypothetical protein CERZMDRAFT_82684 [Cercospora zeae-maydis SCOH1-5]
MNQTPAGALSPPQTHKSPCRGPCEGLKSVWWFGVSPAHRRRRRSSRRTWSIANNAIHNSHASRQAHRQPAKTPASEKWGVSEQRSPSSQYAPDRRYRSPSEPPEMTDVQGGSRRRRRRRRRCCSTCLSAISLPPLTFRNTTQEKETERKEVEKSFFVGKSGSSRCDASHGSTYTVVSHAPVTGKGEQQLPSSCTSHSEREVTAE